MRKWLVVSTTAALLTALSATMSCAIDLGGLADRAKESVPAKTKKDSDPPKKDADIQVKLPDYKGPRKRLAVMDMEVKVQATQSMEPTSTGGTMNTTTVYIPPPTDFGTGLTEMLTTALVNSKRFIVLERKAMMDIQQEQSLGASGSVDQTSAPQTGKLLGAQAMIRGAVTEYTYKKSNTGGNAKFFEGVGLAASKAEAAVVLDIRIYSSVTGQIIDSVKAEGRAKASATAVNIDKPDYKVSGSGFSQSPLGHATRQALERAVTFICERMESMPWEGRIAEMDTGDNGSVSTIYINAGSDTGLKEGDTFEIVRPGRDIVDPETKVVIGRTKDKLLGKCKIETLSKNLSTAVAVEGEGFQVNDIVRLPDPKKTIQSTQPSANEGQQAPQDITATGQQQPAPVPAGGGGQ